MYFFFLVFNHLCIVDCCQILNGFWILCLVVVILCCRWFHKRIEYLFVLGSCLRYACLLCLCYVVWLLLLLIIILIIALEWKILEVRTKLDWVDCLIKLNLFPNEAMLWVVIPILFSNICGYWYHLVTIYINPLQLCLYSLIWLWNTWDLAYWSLNFRAQRWQQYEVILPLFMFKCKLCIMILVSHMD